MTSVTGTLATAAIGADPGPPEPDLRWTPDEVLTLIAADHKTLPDDVARSTRYLSLRAGSTREERDDLARLTVATLNDLSGSPVPIVLVPGGDDAAPTVAGTAAVRVGEALIRVDVSRLGTTFARTWERLGVPEPYWHGDALVPTHGIKYVEYGHFTDAGGNKYAPPRRSKGDRWTTTEVRREPTDEEYVAEHGFVVRSAAGRDAYKAVFARMVDQRTGDRGSDVPVVDADWFIGQTLADYRRDPGYHDFLGFDDLKSWKRLAGVVEDPKVVDESFLTELRGAVAHSTVTNEDVVRRIVQLDKVGGEVWFTNDSNQREVDDPGQFDAADATVNLVDLPKKLRFQAIESLAHKANGYVLKGLFNNRGVRQDVAPDFIASDSTAPFADRRVHTGLCFRCHCRGKAGGFKPVDDWARDKFNVGPNFLASKDHRIREGVLENYARRLERPLDRSRARFADALAETAGLTTERYSEVLEVVWRRWVEGPVDVADAARRLGCTEKRLTDVLTGEDVAAPLRAKGEGKEVIAKAVVEVTTKQHPLLGAFRPDKAGKTERLPAIRWQRIFQRGADAVSGVNQPFVVRDGKEVRP